MGTPSIPLDWYTSQDIFNREKAFFEGMPQYRGHVYMVPQVGDLFTLPGTHDTEMLVHNKHGVQLLSNICRHRQMVMRRGKENHSKIVCPAHCWTYDNCGKLIHANHFKENPQLDLIQFETHRWHGMVFKGGSMPSSVLKSAFLNEQMKLEGWALGSSTMMDCPYNWKIFIDTYLDDYHINIIHPGLRHYVDANRVAWTMEDGFSIQTAPLNPRWREHPASGQYGEFMQLLANRYSANSLNFGVAWILIYPNIMLELYPDALAVSVVHPLTLTKTRNTIEFYFPAELVAAKDPYCAAFEKAYLETAHEDNELCEAIQAGLQHSAAAGVKEAGPFHTPMEDGIMHFHDFLRRQLGETSVQPPTSSMDHDLTA